MDMLSATNLVTDKTVESPQLIKLRETAEQLVGHVFYGTLLKAMRKSSLQGKYGHGGRGEEVFNAQLDQVLAERMGNASHGGLAESIYESMKKQQTSIHQEPSKAATLERLR